MRDLTVHQTLLKMHELQGHLRTLQDAIVVRAKLQEVTEGKYDELVQVVRNCTTLLQTCSTGQVIDACWLARRDELVQQAQQYVLDASTD